MSYCKHGIDGMRGLCPACVSPTQPQPTDDSQAVKIAGLEERLTSLEKRADTCGADVTTRGWRSCNLRGDSGMRGGGTRN